MRRFRAVRVQGVGISGGFVAQICCREKNFAGCYGLRTSPALRSGRSIKYFLGMRDDWREPSAIAKKAFAPVFLFGKAKLSNSSAGGRNSFPQLALPLMHKLVIDN
jgi:hypothetical protein